MNIKYKEQLPLWVTSIEKDYGLILSNDIDSLASCCLLQKETNWKIKAVMLHYFNKYKIEKLGADESPLDYFGVLERGLKFSGLIGVDLALMDGKSFDNHLQIYEDNIYPNPKSVNINNVCLVNRENYKKKYAASTFLMLWSIFNYPDAGISDDLKMLLLSVDAGFKGFYKKTFREYLEHYMIDVLELPNLYDFLAYHDMQDFYDFHRKMNLGRKIYLDGNSYLDSNINIQAIQKIFDNNNIEINLQLPTEQFHRSFYCRSMESTTFPTEKNIFTLSLTAKNQFKYSVIFSEKEKGAKTA